METGSEKGKARKCNSPQAALRTLYTSTPAGKPPEPAVPVRYLAHNLLVMAKHKLHTPPELSEALEHVMYEIWKYRQSVADYRAIQQVGGDAAVEFRVLHHRVLLEFFYGPPKHEENIVAWEYITNWKAAHDRNKIPWLDAYVHRCHTMLAHISTNRSAIAKQGLKDWGQEWLIVEPHLDQTISDFLGGLSDRHKKLSLRWIDRWLEVSRPWSSVLAEIAPALLPS